MSKPGSDNSSRQASADQLTAVARFLDELEAKTPIKHLQKEMDGNKTLLDTINAIITVGAFIAGVQAQMISVTYSSNSKSLGKATNWFSFVGLTLDLIGTSAGVVRALLLQKAIRRSHHLAVRLSGQIDGARHEVREQQERQRHSSAVDPHSRAFLTDSMRAISRAMAIFAEDGRFGVQAAARGGTTGAQTPVEPDPLDRRPSRGKGGINPLRRWVRGMLLNVEGVGHVPIVSLAGGGLCLLLSVVLFAGASQPHAVWLSCTSIAAGMLVWSVTPTINPHKRSRVALYDHVEETLELCPPVNPPVFPASHGSNLGT